MPWKNEDGQFLSKVRSYKPVHMFSYILSITNSELDLPCTVFSPLYILYQNSTQIECGELTAMQFVCNSGIEIGQNNRFRLIAGRPVHLQNLKLSQSKQAVLRALLCQSVLGWCVDCLFFCSFLLRQLSLHYHVRPLLDWSPVTDCIGCLTAWTMMSILCSVTPLQLSLSKKYEILTFSVFPQCKLLHLMCCKP